MNPSKERIEIAARALAEGKSQSDAYRLAYPSSQKWKQEVVHKRASEFFQVGEVLGRVAELLESTLADHEVTKERVITELASQAFTHIGNIVSWDEQGNLTVVPSEDIRPEHMAAVKEVTLTETLLSHGRKDGDPDVISRKLNIKMHNKNTALNLLARLTKVVEDGLKLIDNRRLAVFVVPETAASVEDWQNGAQRYLEMNGDKK